ncbi:MAG: hypothetical protein ABIH23_10590 [bacterium]
MKEETKRQGPWTHRFLICTFSISLTLLLFWLLGFIQHDIGRLPGPNRLEIEKQYVDEALTDRLVDLKKEQQSITTQIENQREIQEILRTSTSSSQQTMNQLLDMHRLNLERGVTPTEVEHDALAESEALFLDNQKKFQEANTTIAALSEQARNIERDIGLLQEEIADKKEPAAEEFHQQVKEHEFKVASLKLSFLVPLLFIATWFVIKKRSGPYGPLVYAMFVAFFWRTGVVMHQHFPREFFKYIAIGAAIIIVLAFLIHLIRMIVSPKKDWLLKQYKEAYNKHLCPICSYPIERGPFKNAVWTSKGPSLRSPIAQGETFEEEKPYSCPSCGSRLFESCEKCSAVRPSLLPFCQACGTEKVLDLSRQF